jgi:hypothetical protein
MRIVDLERETKQEKKLRKRYKETDEMKKGNKYRMTTRQNEIEKERKLILEMRKEGVNKVRTRERKYIDLHV